MPKRRLQCLELLYVLYNNNNYNREMRGMYDNDNDEHNCSFKVSKLQSFSFLVRVCPSKKSSLKQLETTHCDESAD